MKVTKYKRGSYSKKYTNVCTECGTSYQAAHQPKNGVRFCSSNCRVRNHRKNNKV